MSNTLDYGYSKLKRDISEKHGEITNIWQCGVDNRNLALLSEIKSYKNPDLTCETLGITGKKTKYLVERILKVNQDEKLNYLPNKITDNTDNWKTDKHRLVIDFESIGIVLLKGSPLKGSEEKKLYDNEFDIPLLLVL